MELLFIVSLQYLRSAKCGAWCQFAKVRICVVTCAIVFYTDYSSPGPQQGGARSGKATDYACLPRGELERHVLHPCPPALCRSPQQPRAHSRGCEHDHTLQYNRCRLIGYIEASKMATKSNFKRAMPQAPRQAQPSVLASLRTTQMVDESKAILPAGTSLRGNPGFRLIDMYRNHQHNS